MKYSESPESVRENLHLVADRIGSIANQGLYYSRDEYDLARYRELEELGETDLSDVLQPDPYRADGGPYSFEHGARFFVLVSVGPDGIAGTPDDPVYFEQSPTGGGVAGNSTREELWDEERGTWILELAGE